jgi:Mrp family chromosome partitioning ATPase
MKKIKSKNKTVLLIGIDSSYFKTEEDYQKYSNKISKLFHESTKTSGENLPIVVYDQKSVKIELLEINVK